MFRPFTRVLAVGVLATGVTLAGTASAQAPLAMTIDVNHGVPGNTVNATVNTADIAANCPADSTPLVNTLTDILLFMTSADPGDLFFQEEYFGPGGMAGDVPTTYDGVGYYIFGQIGLGVAFDIPAGTTQDAFEQTFALVFANLAQEVQGTPSTFDQNTGLGSLVVPNVAPGLWAVAAACVLPTIDTSDNADLDLLREAIHVAGQLWQDAGFPIEVPDPFDPATQAFYVTIAPQVLQPVLIPQGLGFQLFTVDTQCSDASECQDGDVCNGFEACDFDSTSGAFICQDGDPVSCTGVSAKKLIIVDKLDKAGKAKTVYVAKDGGATKGAGNDVETISVDFKTLYDSASGSFVLPAGSANGWKVNKEQVAKYVNKDAPGGPTEAKVSVIKPGKLIKLVGKGLGDDPIDLITEGAPIGSVFTRFLVDNAGEQNAQCTEFAAAECKFSEIAAGTGRKLVCKNGVANPSCNAGD